MPSNSQATLLPTHSIELLKSAVSAAAEALRAGQVVALPTETVYGLAANALHAQAVTTIFEVKQRPAMNPLIVHVDGIKMAQDCVSSWPREAEELAASFWPGPLTLVLPAAKVIPREVTAGGTTVGVRWPSHPFIQLVIQACGFPLAAPSANISTELSPTRAAHVLERLGDRIPLIVDGGSCQVGIESTVVDLSVSPPQILRPGMISRASLATVIQGLETVKLSDKDGKPMRSPGAMIRHYSPKTKLMIASWTTDTELKNRLHQAGITPRQAHVIAYSCIPTAVGEFGEISVIPRDAEAFARALYAELHRCDAMESEWIVVEKVPDDPEWKAIADRLERGSVISDF